MSDPNFDGVLDPAAGWPDVPQASTDMLLLGGEDGPLNEQARQLTARTKLLKARTDITHSDVLSARAQFGDVPAAAGQGPVVETINAVAQSLADRTEYLHQNQGAEFCPTYAALRAYTGDATRIQIGGRTNYFDGAHGIAVRTGSRADNGGTVWVDALGRSWERQFSGAINTKWFGASGNGADPDTAPLVAFFSVLAQRGRAEFAVASANYKITSTLEIFDKAGSVIDFGNQQINAASFASLAPALHFKKMSQAVIDNIYVVGAKDKVNVGVLFDAAPGEITIHANIGKVNVSGCDTGIVAGTETYQFSDSVMSDLYASDCNTGIRFTGENTLVMLYGRVAAYNNSVIGAHFEQGGGTVASLQVAASHYDLYFGPTSGLNQNKLNRWDITGGYSEEGVAGEVFINSAACADSNPFREQIVISGFRVTPFTSTGVMDFIQWRLNGDLIIKNTTITHGQQEPRIKVDHNTAHRAPRVILENCVIDCNPRTAPQVPMTYALTDNRQIVEIDAAVINGITVWQNDGNINEGTIKRGIYTQKRKIFERALQSIGSLVAAWSLSDLTSGSCKNLVAGGPALALSATPERRDFWLDDGLMGFYGNGGSTSKTASTSSAVFSAGEYTFGCILRCGTSGVDETSYTTLGGVGGIRLGIGNTGGAFLRCQVGSFNCQATPTNPYDPHVIIGRYLPGTHIKVNAMNLRTGELVSASVAGPTLASLTWVNGVSIRNDLCVRGFPFVYNRSLTDAETSALLQSAMALTDSWR